jgi:hypothetical protein
MEDVRKEKPHSVQMCLILEHRIERAKKNLIFSEIGEVLGLKRWLLGSVIYRSTDYLPKKPFSLKSVRCVIQIFSECRNIVIMLILALPDRLYCLRYEESLSHLPITWPDII